MVGAGSRGATYSTVMSKNKEKFQIVAVAEPKKDRRDYIKNLYNLENNMCFESYEPLFELGKIADFAVIATMDKEHLKPALKAIELGYDLLLEKPIAPTAEECIEINNAGGMRAVKYGVTRDYVRALTVVMPNGEIVKLGAKVAKNSSGHSLKDLVVGSEGTLCIITEAVLDIIPLPKISLSLLVPFADMKSAIEAVPKIFKSKVTPTAIEYMSRDTILFAEDYLGKKFPDKKNDAYILLTFDGNTEAQVDEDMNTVAELCLEIGAVDVYIVDTEERKKAVWSARGAFLEAIKSSTTRLMSVMLLCLLIRWMSLYGLHMS